jgi:hypothetical protein
VLFTHRKRGQQPSGGRKQKAARRRSGMKEAAG